MLSEIVSLGIGAAVETTLSHALSGGITKSIGKKAVLKVGSLAIAFAVGEVIDNKLTEIHERWVEAVEEAAGIEVVGRK